MLIKNILSIILKHYNIYKAYHGLFKVGADRVMFSLQESDVCMKQV